LENSSITIILSLILSAFFSSSETAFITFDKLKLLIWLEQKRFYSQALKIFFPHQERFVITNLIGNNIATVAFSSVSAVLLTEKGFSPFLVVLISTLVLLTLGEILPKALGLSFSNYLIRTSAVILWGFYLLFYPIVLLMSIAYRTLFPFQKEDFQPILTRERLKSLIISESGTLESQDADIAEGILTFGRLKMKQVMTPRTDVVALEESASIEELSQIVFDKGHSKIAIYRKHIDNILGYVHALDLILSEAKDLNSMLRPAIFVSEFTSVIEALKTMRKNQLGMLFILDEYGGFDGIATLEDIAEELFGEIEDEFDRPKFKHHRLGESKFLVSGRAEIDDLKRRYGWDLEKAEGVETFAGWLTTNLGRIPRKGEKLQLGDLTIQVMLADEVSVKILKVEKTTHSDRHSSSSGSIS
jgi:CBS domain containing-hemolysin-like protein